jgi:hypothetical protein
MKSANRIHRMTTAALLCAIGIVIPRFPDQNLHGAGSYTLASHVAIMIAMFISPATPSSCPWAQRRLLSGGFSAGHCAAGGDACGVFRCAARWCFTEIRNF